MLSTLQEKVDFLRKANRSYRDGVPIISDDEYDALELDVREEDPNNSFFREVEDGLFGLSFPLTIAMGSQDKAHNLQEMDRFYNRVDTNESISASEKMDGMSFELTYRYGNFVLALSRGDGHTGVDYTSIIRGAKGIPHRIKDKSRLVVVRGEVIILKSDLLLLNIELEKDGRKPYDNARNGVSGLVKSLKNIKYSKYISFRAFNVESRN